MQLKDDNVSSTGPSMWLHVHAQCNLVIQTSSIWHLDYPDTPKCASMHVQRVGSVSMWGCGDR